MDYFGTLEAQRDEASTSPPTATASIAAGRKSSSGDTRAFCHHRTTDRCTRLCYQAEPQTGLTRCGRRKDASRQSPDQELPSKVFI
jgi:hypothetical protein